MKKLGLIAAFLAVIAFAVPSVAAKFEFHGDLNNRFQYNNHQDFFASGDQGPGLGGAPGSDRIIDDSGVEDFYAEIKYRFWTIAATDDNNVKAVLATEIGGLRFGEVDKLEFSGDEIRFEVRWAYLDFQLPFVEQKARARVGLAPINVNPWLWKETAATVNLTSQWGDVDWQLGWARGFEIIVTDDDDNRSDVDGFWGRVNFKPTDDLQVGLFGLLQTFDADGQGSNIDSTDYHVKFINDALGYQPLYTIGTDGNYNFGNFFVNWDLMYQGGELEDVDFTDFASGVNQTGDFDVSAYFAHVDVGYKMDKWKFTYTGWYHSGDGNDQDGDFESFLQTDIDVPGSLIILGSGQALADDDVFTERSQILDKGYIMNRLSAGYQATEKLYLEAAAMYMLTAEDIEYVDDNAVSQSKDEIGFEIDLLGKYQLYKNLELALQFGYLFADDAMDVFEVTRDGSSDEDLYLIESWLRFKF